jgi:hypothetical protein
MRSLTVDECGVVSGGLLQSPFGDIGSDPFRISEPKLPSAMDFVFQLEKNNSDSCKSSDGGVCAFFTTDSNGTETVWIFGQDRSAVEAALCQLNSGALGAASGYALGKWAGSSVGMVTGIGLGALAVPWVGPAGVPVGGAAGYWLGGKYGGAVGGSVGGYIGGYIGAYYCNGG